jgi:3-deoxy-7-phosphoheptulonate synthase
MVVVMKERATLEQIEAIVAQLMEMGFDVHRSVGATRTVIGAVGQGRGDAELLAVQDGVHEVPANLRAVQARQPDVQAGEHDCLIGDVRIGGEEVIVMAGPCSAESEAQVEATASAVKRAGAKILRGGAFKPRSSPYSFQGLGEEGCACCARPPTVTS